MGQPGTVAPPRAGVFWYRAVAFAVTFAAAWGSLSGTPSRMPARASAPASLAIPGVSAAGPIVRLDDGKTHSEPPTVVEAGHQLTVAAQRPDRRVVTVHQPAGAP